jgi:Fe-S-cluster containining protein
MALFENHALSWSHVYTIRKGEKVFSPIENRFLTLNAEMIKIKEIPKTKLCLFFVSNQDRASECAIYGNRPLQCKAQKCWDTRDIEKTFKKVKLTRKEIIRGHNALVELIDAHDERCKTADFYTAMTDFQENNRSYALWDIVAYDMEFRRLITAQLSVQQEEIDFLFGRSFHELLNAYGYTVEQP